MSKRILNPPRAANAFHTALKVAIWYFTISVLWIALSDRLVEMLFASPHALSVAQTWKGWFFVSATALALFLFLLKNGWVLEQLLENTKASELRFRSLFEEVPSVAVQGIDDSGKILFWNEACSKFYGFDAKEAMGQNFEKFLASPLEGEEAKERFFGFSGEVLKNRKDGSMIQVYSAHVEIKNIEGKREIYCLDVDLSALKQAEAKIRLAEVVFDRSADGIIVTDADNCIVSANDSFCRMSGYLLQELLGKQPNMFSSGRHSYSYYAELWRDLLESGSWRGEILNRRKNGDIYCGWMTISAVTDLDGSIKNFVAIISDITEKKNFEARLEYVSNHDDLTGLPNALLLRDRGLQALTMRLRDSKKVALCVLDIDHFRIVNDSLGHVIGDRLLKLVVERVAECLSEKDTLSRRGGDELSILLPDVDARLELPSLLESILQQFAKSFEIDRNVLNITASIGVALYPDDAKDFDDLMLKAETAMYSAKQSGRNTKRFYSGQMNTDSQERFALQNRLAQAIEKGELVLHYQPQFDLRSGALVGAEALVRWRDGERGLISPAKFIPVAEETGLIVPIGEWVLRQACVQAQAWLKEGFPEILLAVNLSALQFKQINFVDGVANVLNQTGLPPRCLELELTESLLVDDADETLLILRELKAIGVQLAIDDFGTGYSSLAYLKKYPIDKLKIDQSFVRDIAESNDDAAIVHTIVQLGRNLKMETLAEGVETESQLAFLKVEGCQMGQGYLFGRPVPAEDFRRFFKPASFDDAYPPPAKPDAVA